MVSCARSAKDWKCVKLEDIGRIIILKTISQARYISQRRCNEGIKIGNSFYVDGEQRICSQYIESSQGYCLRRSLHFIKERNDFQNILN